MRRRIFAAPAPRARATAEMLAPRSKPRATPPTPHRIIPHRPPIPRGRRPRNIRPGPEKASENAGGPPPRAGHHLRANFSSGVSLGAKPESPRSGVHRFPRTPGEGLDWGAADTRPEGPCPPSPS